MATAVKSSKFPDLKKKKGYHAMHHKDMVKTRPAKKSVTAKPGKPAKEKVLKSPLKNKMHPKNPENKMKWVPFGRGN